MNNIDRKGLIEAIDGFKYGNFAAMGKFERACTQYFFPKEEDLETTYRRAGFASNVNADVQDLSAVVQAAERLKNEEDRRYVEKAIKGCMARVKTAAASDKYAFTTEAQNLYNRIAKKGEANVANSSKNDQAEVSKAYSYLKPSTQIPEQAKALINLIENFVGENKDEVTIAKIGEAAKGYFLKDRSSRTTHETMQKTGFFLISLTVLPL